MAMLATNTACLSGSVAIDNGRARAAIHQTVLFARASPRQPILESRRRAPLATQGLRGALQVTAAVKVHEGGPDASRLRFAVVVARFNDIVTRPLLEGALRSFARHGAKEENIVVVWVPGAFELGAVTKSMARSANFDAVLALGAVVRGDTTHYDAVAGAAASGVLSASMDSGVPCIFGVLTCENMEQAMDRAGGKAGNNGEKSAATAVEMANLMQGLVASGHAAKPIRP